MQNVTQLEAPITRADAVLALEKAGVTDLIAKIDRNTLAVHLTLKPSAAGYDYAAETVVLALRTVGITAKQGTVDERVVLIPARRR